MKVRMGAVRTLGLGTVAMMMAAGLGVVGAPAAHAVEPAFPAPTSPSWLPVKKASAPLTDGAGEVDAGVGYLDLTAAGGPLGNAVAFVHANVQHAYFRFHVATLPADGAAGGYVIQFDTDNNPTGWERALRYDPVAGTVTFFTAPAPGNSPVTEKGAAGPPLALTAASRTKYAGADGGAHVAFAVPRDALKDAGIKLGAPMVVGATTQPAADFGAALNADSLLFKAKADILGVGKGKPAWQNVASDLLAIDSDGDGVDDNLDNCPTDANPGQEDDDKATTPPTPGTDFSLPPGTSEVPDGTEGQGNVCDETPRGYDRIDHDGVGMLDDQCPEQYGILANGCVAQSTTTAVLRYVPKQKRFAGVVRADYEQCVPRRTVTVFRSVAGPDRSMGSVKTTAVGRYSLELARRAPRGKYYAEVDRKWTLGARCFRVKSPRIEVR